MFLLAVGTEDVMWYGVGIVNGVARVRTSGARLALGLVWSPQ